MLWDVEVAGHERRMAAFDRNDFDATDAAPEQPTWSEAGLAIAEAIRKHLPVIHIGQPDHIEGEAAYVHFIDHMRQTYGHLVQIVPADTKAAELGKAEHKHFAEHRSRQARLNARIADIPIPTGVTGKTLYQAIDAYAERAERASTKEGAKVEAATARRLKDSTPDMDVCEFAYTAMERIRDHWASRPPAKCRNSKTPNKPIGLTTVDNHLSTARRFVRWLDRASDYKWEMPRHGLDALKVDLRRLKTDEEIARQRHGVEVFTVEQLAMMYGHATNYERVLLLLGLNTAASHAEALTLRWDEVEGKTIKRVRRKSGVYGEFSLWSETTKALHWWKSLQLSTSPLLLTTSNGNAYTRIRIANSWTQLRSRIEKDTGHPCGWWLSFKFLRKTAAQLIRHVSDGEISGVFLSHGQPVATDDLSDVYSRRPFDKLSQALAKVELQLSHMFAAAPGAFAISKMGRGASKRSVAPAGN